MDMKHDQRIESYLSGALPPDDTRLFEAELAEPHVARAFSEALLIRFLMKTPVEVPVNLEGRIALAVGASEEEEDAAAAEKGTSALDGVLAQLSWMVRGPSMFLSNAQTRQAGLSGVVGAMGTVGYVLAPVSAVRRRDAGLQPASKKRPAWRRVLGWTRRRPA
jgi:hypothetical protein